MSKHKIRINIDGVDFALFEVDSKDDCTVSLGHAVRLFKDRIKKYIKNHENNTKGNA